MKNELDSESSEELTQNEGPNLKEKPIKRRSKFTAWLVAFISSLVAFIFLCFLSALLGMTVENMGLIVKMIIVFGTFGVYNFVYRSLRPKKNKL